jgi:hypothetical protein
MLKIASMQGRCTPAEWQARTDLAACYRLLDLYGMSDMMANHVSSHVPGEPGAFLINAYGMMYEEITASSLIKVDLAGETLASPERRQPARRPRRRQRQPTERYCGADLSAVQRRRISRASFVAGSISSSCLAPLAHSSITYPFGSRK